MDIFDITERQENVKNVKTSFAIDSIDWLYGMKSSTNDDDNHNQ